MPISTLIASGTTAATSADTTLVDGAVATLVLTGEGTIFIEAKTVAGTYITVQSLTTKTPVQKVYGPLVFRARREVVQETFAPGGIAPTVPPVGIEAYTDAPMGGSGAPLAVTGPATNAELRATPLPTTDTLNGTRAYNWATGTREAFTTTSTAALALPMLGTRREARFISSARCFVRFGGSGVGAATVASGQAIFPADCPEVIVIPVDATHYRVIGETAGGSLSITPVA